MRNLFAATYVVPRQLLHVDQVPRQLLHVDQVPLLFKPVAKSARCRLLSAAVEKHPSEERQATLCMFIIYQL